MTSPLDRPGNVKIVDPDPALVDRLRGLYLVYPYINFPARSNTANWLHTPKTFVVLANKDHLTPIRHSEKVFGRLKAQGVDVTTLVLDASHAFDEEDNKGLIMQYDPAVMQASLEGLLSFVAERFELA